MAPESGSKSARTLLAVLEDPADQAAWGRFVDRYAPGIYGWCCRRGLRDTDAREVTQLLLGKLYQHLSAYESARGRFRPWLHRVTRNAWRNCLLEYRRRHGDGDSRVRAVFQAADAGEELARAMDDEFRRELLDVAMARVRQRVRQANTWEAFRLTAREGVKAGEAASRLGMSITAVYMARNQVQDMLKDEIARLEEAPPTRGRGT
jgi:RNA polymerase sigma-70 factor (ECF subfamily)